MRRLTVLSVLLVVGLSGRGRAVTRVSAPGGTNAQAVINDAINREAAKATVSSKGEVVLGSGTFTINAPILLKSNVRLVGQGEPTVITGASAETCHSSTQSSYVYGSGVSGVEVAHLKFRSPATKSSDGGHGDYRNAIQFRSVKDSEVHHVSFTRYLFSDGVRISASDGIRVHDCKMLSAGHDGVALLSGTKNSRVYNNLIEIQTNTGVRCDGCADCEISNNEIRGYGTGSGWCCVQLQNALVRAKVHHNIFHDYSGYKVSAGIGNWTVPAKGTFTISNNVMWNLSPYSQLKLGTGNVLGPSDRSVANWVAKGYGVQPTGDSSNGGGGSSSHSPSPTPSPSTPSPSSSRSSPEPPKVFVAGSGMKGGDYVVGPSEDAAVVINEAIEFVDANRGKGFTTVHLKGPFTYTIKSTIKVANGVTLTGDPSATVKLMSSCQWAAGVPLITAAETSCDGVTASGFKIDGNRGGNSHRVSGKDFHNLVSLTECSNVDVHGLTMVNGHGEGVKLTKCANVKVHGNSISEVGHEGVYAISCTNIEAFQNVISTRGNSGIRLYNTDMAQVHDNEVSGGTSGGAGIEVQKYGAGKMTKVRVSSNLVHGTWLAGVWVLGGGSYAVGDASVEIDNNVIYDVGRKTDSSVLGGILVNGFSGTLHNNVIDGAAGAAIVQRAVAGSAPGSGYVIKATKNVMTFSTSTDSGGEGYGVLLSSSAQHSFSLSSNCLWSNEAGSYSTGVSPGKGDVVKDPLFVSRSKHDYHLRSGSPCQAIGAGVVEFPDAKAVDGAHTSSVFLPVILLATMMALC